MNAPNPVQTFLAEAADLLDQIEECALEAERNPRDAEAINRLFRAFHTIKGCAAMFGFEAVAGFTHHIETALDRVRGGGLAVTARLVELLLAARDHIHGLLGQPSDAAPDARTASLVAAFAELLAATPDASPAPTVAAAADESGPAAWRIHFRPPADLAAAGLNPLLLLDDLRSLGPCTVAASLEAVPPLEALDAERCHLAWDLQLTTDRGFNAIKDVFIFIEDGSDLVIERIAPPPASPTANLPPAPAAPSAPAASRPAPEATVRVPAVRLDRLVTLVGELVMNQSRLTQVAARVPQPELTVPVEELERLIGELRDTVLGIRMMPIGTTFARFKRLVHDLAAELHKEIDLVTEGAGTELDKTMLDRLGDPLVHLIRNSIDHGIESPAERVRAGKPARGTIRLTAVHTGSNVVLTVGDDGRGLDADAIRTKAIEKHLVSADGLLSAREIHQLILLPGFSTARQVTSVSGRGVGMDVVKRELELLRGTLQIASEPGAGTTISATLPLTLAIIEGLLVDVAGDRFIVPMAAVHETVELSRTDRTRHNGRHAIAIRGELIPYLRLREAFGGDDRGPDVEKLVIIHHGADRLGLVVDRVLGSHQTVIQSLGRFYRDIGILSGATIMGDGRVALILDLGGLLRLSGLRAA